MDGAVIRPERTDDHHAIATLLRAAFGRDAEAELVRRLRKAGALAHSLVAETADGLAGYVALSPVTINGAADAATRWLGLGPLAVHPNQQRRGFGAMLVRAALSAAEAGGADLVTVLGEPGYYARFGFVAAIRYGLTLPWPVPDEASMAWRGPRRSSSVPRGTVGYHPAFAATV